MNKKKIITLTLVSTIMMSGLLGCSNINRATADKEKSVAVTAQEDIKTSSKDVEDKVDEISKENVEKTIDTSSPKEALTEGDDRVEDSNKDMGSTSNKQAKPVVNTQTNNASKKESVNTKNSSVQAVNETSNKSVSTSNKSVSTSNSIVNQAAETDNSSINYWAEVEDAIIAIVNQERSKNGQASLSLNSQMKNIARDKSKEMIQLNYFDHNSPKNGYVSDVLKKQGISYHWVGENIAMFQGGSMSSDAMAKKLMDMWMNSPGHRANILNGNFKEIGIGVARQGNLIKATQVFYTKQ